MGLLVGAHAALFNDHVALLVKLPHHGMQEALGFEVRPEFEAIFRQREMIGGFVVAGMAFISSPPFCSTSLPKALLTTYLSASAMASFQAFSRCFNLAASPPTVLSRSANVSGVGNFDLL